MDAGFTETKIIIDTTDVKEETVFDRFFSRRLGSSLGINLLPSKGKICNFDCIYCECGWNKDGRSDQTLPSASDVKRRWRKIVGMLKGRHPIDSITFPGDGSLRSIPNSEIIRDTIELRGLYYPKSLISVLSNATMINKEEVFEALKLVDNPILKLDAPSDELTARINQPQVIIMWPI